VNRHLWLCCVAAGLLSHAAPATAADDPGTAAPMAATRLSTPPAIDGILDDEAWTGTPLPTGTWLSYNPLHGDQIPQQTRVWVGYDAEALYFAFRCDDPEPGRIKTSITRRDNIWPDDWVGLSLDALGTGQISYHLMVNPSGIQLDMVNTIAGYEDTSPDWIWESAGHVDARGYAVEIRLPLQSIRFNGGDDVRMGILFWRRVSRTGTSVAWPALEPGKWVFEKHARLVFENLRARPTRELIPSATYSRAAERETPSRWGVDHTGDLGLSAKWGLTDTITLDATVNPDFSQVESDAFQVEVNQRFPVYYSEKRPFFMEGAGIFNLAGNAQGDSAMLYAVNTRNVVDPIFGAKLTGSAGRVTFASLTAVDQAPGRIEDPTDPLSGKEQLFQVARAQMSLKPGSYAGAIATLTNLAGRTNAVAGGDISLKFRGSQQVSAFLLGSTTGRPDAERGTGVALQANYSYNSRRVNVSTMAEHYDRAFEMDTAFLTRTGVTDGWVYTDYNFYPDKDRHPWIRRITPFAFVQGGRDRVQAGDEFLVVSGARLSFTRQGFFRADVITGQEPFRGREFDRLRWRMSGNVQLFRWLRPYARVNWGKAVYYDDVDPFLGRSVDTGVGALFQPNGRFSEDVEFTRTIFDRPTLAPGDTSAPDVSPGRVYTVNIVNTRTTFQFTKAFAVRAIVQYESQRHRVLTDFLGSYEPRPGTVVYAGYGSLYEKRRYEAPDWIDGEGAYLTTRRGVFLKASYLYRF
jgi:hypothetical protein